MKQAAMSQGRSWRVGKLLPWIVGGFVLWQVFKPKGDAPQGNRFAQGPVRVSARVMQAQVAPMGAHLVVKNPGQTVTVTVSWMGNAVAASGEKVSWPYTIRAALVPAGLGSPIVADATLQLGSVPSGVVQSHSLTLTIPAGATHNTQYDALVWITTYASNNDGTPNTATAVDSGSGIARHDNAIVVKIVGPTVVGATITSVTTAQLAQQMGMLQNGHMGHGGPVRVSAQLGPVQMGAHQVVKARGAPILVDVPWTGKTTNAAGSGISWTYRIEVGLKIAGTNVQVASAESAPVTVIHNQLITTPLSLTVPAAAPDGEIYDVTAYVQALGSDAQGVAIPNSFTRISGINTTHASAVRVQVVGAATPGATISTITVAQLAQRMGMRQ